MAAVPFGCFTLIDLHGDTVGAVVIAPEHVLLQRSASTEVHDLSYLAVWSAVRMSKIRRELTMLVREGRSAVDSGTPELAAILRAIDPTATALFGPAGECGRTFARRRLKAALKAAAVHLPPGAAARSHRET